MCVFIRQTPKEILRSSGIPEHPCKSLRADCGSCSKEIVSEIEKHCKHFYIRANRCSSLYNDIFALRGWKTEEINGIQFELNSILVEMGRQVLSSCHQRQRRNSGDLDLWEGEYTTVVF